ncbi:RNA polymerase sigma factor [Actinomadura chibensis]|uniref:Sigma-70 family RNA polymerase sigma factor n=1 Tax=Actinomadura chibensis TaxID=392828 RepID=A0A5D0NPZ8_9ACTN|nr:sigma-70 family RNA polymerase sigma factor [Actinomadura chibensis]TYB46274.1 sigma-70 family RNA polymerase sigma factor [Actinomadura chibensis]
MHGDLEALYDAHAHRLYAHCWSLVGDRGAADALRDTLTEAVRQTPQGELVLFLHHLARTVCSERGAFSRHGHALFAPADTDPLLNAAGRMPAQQREALLLAAGEWLDVRDIARVVGIAPGAVRERLHEARTGLERLVLDALMRGAADPAEHMDVIAAFEQGRLPHLLARRAPGLAPAPLRDHVLGADDEYDVIGDEPVTPGRPLVVIGADGADRGRSRRRKALKGVGGVAGVAATVAVGLLMTWPSADEGTVNALGPPDGGTRPGTTGGVDGGTERPGAAPTTAAPDPRPTTEKQKLAAAEPPRTDGGNATGLQKSPERETPSAPSTPPPDSRQQPPPPASAPPKQQQPPPPDDGAHRDNPLKPVTDIVDHLATPILSGLAGQ